MYKRKSLEIITLIVFSLSVSMGKSDRLPTKEQFELAQEKQLWESILKAEAEKPIKAAQAKLKRERLDQYRGKERRALSEQEKLKRLLHKSNRWQKSGRRGVFLGQHRLMYRATGDDPTVLINGVSAATIGPGESFVISVTFSAGQDSALVDVFYDADKDTVADPEDISLFAYLFPEGDGGPEAPFWIYDNSEDDENPAAGEYQETVDDFPYMGMSVIMQVKDGGGTGQAYLTVGNLSGDHTASGTVSPITAPALVLFFQDGDEGEQPWMTFTNPAGSFSFGFSGTGGTLFADGGFFLGAMDVVLGIESGGYLLRGSFFDNPSDLDGVTLDITRNAAISGSVMDAENGLGIKDAWVGAFSGPFFQFLFSYTTSVSNSVGQFTLPLQGGNVYEDVYAWHPDYMGQSCMDSDYPFYVSEGETLNVNCEMQPWPAFIEGVVTDAETDEPLADINVEINMWDRYPEPMMGDRPPGPGGMGFSNDTWTDENGRYRLGSIFGQGELCAFDWDNREYQDVCIFPFLVSQSLVKHDLQLHPFDGMISGVVTDATTGTPIPDANVYSFSTVLAWGQWDITNHEGRYELPVVNGTYTVCAAKWEEGYDENCVENIIVLDDTATANVALKPPDGFIQGHVYNAVTQKPVSGIGVSAFGDRFFYFTETDHEGFFNMGVNNGVYEVCFIDWTNTYEDSCFRNVVVSDDTRNLNVYLSPIQWDGAIAGKVADEFANPIMAWVGAIDTTTWEGNGTITDLMTAEYLLPLNNGNYVAMAFPLSSGYVSDFKSGIVVNFDTTTAVDFVTPLVKIDAVLRGAVLDTVGNPLKGAWVAAGVVGPLEPFDHAAPGNMEMEFYDETDSAGKYEIEVMGFADRYYWIYAGYSVPETGEFWVGGRDSVLIQSKDTVTVDLEVAPIFYGSEISGFVTVDGEPVVGAEVTIYVVTTGEYFSAFTDENGFFSMAVPNGDYTVCVSIPEQHMMDCQDIFVENMAAAMDFEFGFVRIDRNALLPERFTLHQNRPNPFNPVTTIHYDLPELRSVRLTVYDLLGREVKTVVNGIQSPGFHRVTWDGRDRFGQQVGTGVYIYQIRAGDFLITKKLLLLR